MSKATKLHDDKKAAARRYRATRDYDAYKVACDRFTNYTAELVDRLNDAGLSVTTAHAYTPRETGSHGGGDHIVLTADLDTGRLKRKAGDALCKPRAKFWGLEAMTDKLVTCKVCAERAERLLS